MVGVIQVGTRASVGFPSPPQDGCPNRRRSLARNVVPWAIRVLLRWGCQMGAPGAQWWLSRFGNRRSGVRARRPGNWHAGRPPYDVGWADEKRWRGLRMVDLGGGAGTSIPD
jgi:hypothetical protein